MQQQQQQQFTQQSTWIKIHEEFKGEVSINAVAFAPHTYGLCLAAAAQDGTVLVLTRRPDTNTWDRTEFAAHKGGANAVSWAPDQKTALIAQQPAAPAPVAGAPAASAAVPASAARRLVTGGCDASVKVWSLDESSNQWLESERGDVFSPSSAAQHADWVRDVAWAPSLGLPANTIASASEDRQVHIFNEDMTTRQWNLTKTLSFSQAAYRVSWSISGNLLAVSLADGTVSLWKEAQIGEWKQIQSVQQEQQQQHQQLQ